MLTKDLLRVSRAGGGYHLQFAGEDDESLAARVLGTYQGHVGETRETLQEALSSLEREADDFKLVRGFAALVERDATFETVASLPPRRARRAVFEAAEDVGVVTDDERTDALAAAADALGSDPDAVAESLYADLDERQRLTELDARWTPAELVAQYNLSLAQTALFDATEVRIQSSDPKRLISAVKRLRLLYEIHRDPREVVVTGPDALFHATRRYGTRFARLLRTVATADEWTLTATVDDRGTDRELTLSEASPVRVPGVDPVTEMTFDSDVEADFARRFASLDLDWTLTREPAPLETGTRVMIPDFAFEYQYGDARVYFEVMGFWTPEYVEKKLGQLADLEDVTMLVAVDESLGVDADVEAMDHRVVTYRDRVRVKDVRDALRTVEARLVADQRDALPDALEPAADVVTLADLAREHGVSEAALDGVRVPTHERIGTTFVRPSVLAGLREDIEAGMDYETASERIEAAGIDEVSAGLAALGYRVAWEGLSGGTIRERDG